MNTHTPRKKASKMHVFLYVLIVILVLGLIAKPGEPIIIEKDAPVATIIPTAPIVNGDDSTCPIAFNLFGCTSLQVNTGQLKKGSSATFYFERMPGYEWSEYISVFGADLVSFEAINSDDSIRMVRIENVYDGVLISIPGLYPLDVLSSGESLLLDEFPYVQYGSSTTLTFQAADDLVIWPDQIEVSGVTSYTFEVPESDPTLMYVHLNKVDGPVSVSFNTTRSYMYLTGTWKLNDNLTDYSFYSAAFDVYTNRLSRNGWLKFKDNEILLYESSSSQSPKYTIYTGYFIYGNFDFEVISPTKVSITFYEWLCANATQVS